ncbi:MAG: hypothetical protein HY513_05105 [Candidatus Aenigmarchaeota archaeon]|nr:hypothetical protein [Candidatus Aenigmarchaeota archaeon]
MGIRLSQSVPEYMRMCSRNTEFRRLAQREVGFVDPATLWGVLEENSRYADFVNFSSRSVGNEEKVYIALVGAPSCVSQQLLERYEEHGYLEMEDVYAAYRIDYLANDALFNPWEEC